MLSNGSEAHAMSQLALLRGRLPTIAPYPEGCVAFDGRPAMNGTAFFPGGDRLWTPNAGDRPAFPIGGVLVLGSDFGDSVSYDAQFERDVAYRSEIDGGTWPGLLKVVDLAGILRTDLFCTNAWPSP